MRPSTRPRNDPVTPSIVWPARLPEPHGRPHRGVHARREAAPVQDRDPGPAAGRLARLGDPVEHLDHVREGGPAGRHRLLVLPGLDEPGDLAGALHGVHQRCPVHAVVAHADELGLVVGPGLDHLERGRVAEQGGHPAVVGARRPAPLDVPEDGHAHVLPEPVRQHVAHVGRGDRPAVAVGGALGHDDDGLAPPGGPALAEPGAHVVLPALGRGVLRDEHVVRPAGDRGHQRQVAAVPAHHLDHERALVAGRGAGQGVDRLEDPVQRRVGAHGHVRPDHVVVDRPDHPGDDQVAVARRDLRGHGAGLDQLGQQLRPLGAEHVGAGQRSVAADHHQPVDAPLEQVVGRTAAPVAGAEVGRAGGADHGAAAVQDGADRPPLEALDPVAAVDQALQPLEHRVHVGAGADRGAHHRAHHGVHPGGVAARGQDRDGGSMRVRGCRHGVSNRAWSAASVGAAGSL